MNYKRIMLSKRIYTQKSTYCVIPHMQNYRDRKQITGHQGLQVGGGLTAKGHEGYISGNGIILYLDSSDGYTIVCICQNSQKCTPKRVSLPYANFTPIEKNRIVA